MFNDISRILYTDWHIALLLFYMVFAMLYLCLKPHLKVFKVHLFFGLLVLFSFYFIIPVNNETQYKFSQNVHDFKRNNKGELINLQIEINSCKGYLTAFKFFKIKSAFNRDFDIILNKNKYISMGEFGESKDYIEKKVCDL